MKQPFFYFLILIGISLKSQNLVLTQSFNQPTVGDTNLVYPMDTLGFSSAMPIGLIGNNITWDFTKLNAKPNILETAYISPTTVTKTYAATTAHATTGPRRIHCSMRLFTTRSGCGAPKNPTQ